MKSCPGTIQLKTPIRVEDDLKLVPIFLLWTKGEEKEDQLDRNYFYELFFLIKWFSFKTHRWREREPPWQKWCLGKVGWCAGLYQFLTFLKLHFQFLISCIFQIFFRSDILMIFTRWRSSLWKLLWKELLVYTLVGSRFCFDDLQYPSFKLN